MKYWLRIGRYAIPIYFIAPSVLLIGVIYFYPAFDILRLSFSEATLMTGPIRYIGLANYRYFFTDPSSFRMIRTTLLWLAASVSGSIVLGTSIALFLNLKFVGRNIIRAITFIPWVLPESIIAAFWRWTLHPMYGQLNTFLNRMGIIDGGINYFSMQNALWTVIIVRIWRLSPFAVITILAALQIIPEELYEAASLDGATYWQKFRYITAPMIRPTIVLTLILMTIWTSITFELILVMTGGGPVNITRIISIDIYKNAFGGFRVGQAAASSVILLFFLLLLTSFYYRFLGGRKGD